MALSGNTPIPKIIALTLLVFGVGLLFWGYDMSSAAVNQLSSALTGSHSDKIVYTYIAGAVSTVVGLYLYFKR